MKMLAVFSLPFAFQYPFKRQDPNLGTAISALVNFPVLTVFVSAHKCRKIVPAYRATTVFGVHDHHPLSWPRPA